MHKLHDSHFIVVHLLGGRKYELVPFLKPEELQISVDEMRRRAELLEANLGEEDAHWILDHQSEIPAELRMKITLVFTTWRSPDRPRGVACVSSGDEQWFHFWTHRRGYWNGDDRLVRRVQ